MPEGLTLGSPLQNPPGDAYTGSPGFIDGDRSLAPDHYGLGSEQELGPNTERIHTIADTVGATVLADAQARGEGKAQAEERAQQASMLSRWGSSTTADTHLQDERLREASIHTDKALQKGLPIGAILATHAVRQEQIVRAAQEMAMTPDTAIESESGKEKKKRRKSRKSDGSDRSTFALAA